MTVLTGWKEIADHLRQGVRTVQRWELSGLPIHRVGENQRGPVFAFVEEVEAWERATPTGTAKVIQQLQSKVTSLEAEVRLLKRENSRLKREYRQFRKST
jgi:predicted RNase H-like nuclease (RuvC/YqgF family)